MRADRRIPHRKLYALTGDGLRFAVFYTKAYDRMLRPLMAGDQPQAPPPRRAPRHRRRSQQAPRRSAPATSRLTSYDRTRLNGRQGAAIWCGHGVFARNLIELSGLAS